MFTIPDGNEIVPVATETSSDIVILPLSRGTQFALLSSPVDNVGNRKTLKQAMRDLARLDFPIVVAACPNNCSDNGNCTVFGDCVCEDGFYGSICSQGACTHALLQLQLSDNNYTKCFYCHVFLHIETPPSEPPIFEIPPSVTVLENEPIFIQIAARIPGTNDTEGLYLYVENLPARSTFSRGRREGVRWIFTPQDFGEIELVLPDFSGMLNLEITAVTPGASRQRSLLITVHSNTTGVNTTDETATTTDQAPATTPEVTKGTPEVTPEATGHGGTKALLYIAPTTLLHMGGIEPVYI